MPYTRQQLLQAVRTDHPELSAVDDNKLFAAIATDHPDLAQGIEELHQPDYQSPRYPTGSGTAGQVVSDQAANVLSGVPSAVTAIPGAIKEGGASLWEALRGRGSQRAQSMLTNAASSAVQPLTQVAKGAAELARNPDSYTSQELQSLPNVNPDSPEWTQAAKTSGAMLAGAELPNVISGAGAIVAPLMSKLRGSANMSAITKSPELNKWMNVTPRAMEHGANPAQQILQDRLLATTKPATQANVKAALKTAGNEMENALYDATLKGAPPLNAGPIVDKALNNVTKKIGTPRDPAFQAQIAGIRSDIANAHPNLNTLTPKQSQALIEHLGDSINWHAATENPINDALIEIYRDLRQAQTTIQVPQLKPLLSKWQNLYVGDKALSGSALKDAAGVGTGNSLLWNKMKSTGKKAAIGAGITATALGAKKAIDLLGP